jgi:predicted enzyme related to lactoylglutathione lyase
MIVDSYVDGTPSWVDLMTTDQDAAVTFYGDLFDWEFMKSGAETGGYAMCMKDGEPVAGIGAMPAEAPFPAAWTTYLSVGDVDAAVAKATDAGGQVMSPSMTVADAEETLGRMAIIADPTGGVFGVWEPGTHIGARRVNEAGSLVWSELRSTDPEDSKAFLTNLFGYSYDAPVDDSGMEYHVIQVGDKMVGGVMGMPPGIPSGMPSHWGTYFATADTDETMAKAIATGATLRGEPMDSPSGRMAFLSDPQGAAFAVMQIPN